MRFRNKKTGKVQEYRPGKNAPMPKAATRGGGDMARAIKQKFRESLSNRASDAKKNAKKFAESLAAPAAAADEDGEEDGEDGEEDGEEDDAEEGTIKEFDEWMIFEDGNWQAVPNGTIASFGDEWLVFEDGAWDAVQQGATHPHSGQVLEGDEWVNPPAGAKHKFDDDGWMVFDGAEWIAIPLPDDGMPIDGGLVHEGIAPVHGNLQQNPDGTISVYIDLGAHGGVETAVGWLLTGWSITDGTLTGEASAAAVALAGEENLEFTVERETYEGGWHWAFCVDKIEWVPERAEEEEDGEEEEELEPETVTQEVWDGMVQDFMKEGMDEEEALAAAQVEFSNDDLSGVDQRVPSPASSESEESSEGEAEFTESSEDEEEGEEAEEERAKKERCKHDNQCAKKPNCTRGFHHSGKCNNGQKKKEAKKEETPAAKQRPPLRPGAQQCELRRLMAETAASAAEAAAEAACAASTSEASMRASQQSAAAATQAPVMGVPVAPPAASGASAAPAAADGSDESQQQAPSSFASSGGGTPVGGGGPVQTLVLNDGQAPNKRPKKSLKPFAGLGHTLGGRAASAPKQSAAAAAAKRAAANADAASSPANPPVAQAKKKKRTTAERAGSNFGASTDHIDPPRHKPRDLRPDEEPEEGGGGKKKKKKKKQKTPPLPTNGSAAALEWGIDDLTQPEWQQAQGMVSTIVAAHGVSEYDALHAAALARAGGRQGGMNDVKMILKFVKKL